MKIRYILYWAILIFTHFGCKKYEMPGPIDLPKSVAFGESMFYVDGKRYEVLSRCSRYPGSPYIDYFFQTNKPVAGYSVELLTGVKPGLFKNGFSFNQTRGDRDINSYAIIKDGTQFFEITAVDTVSMKVQGWFQFKVERTHLRYESPNTRTHKEFWVQGVFHERYTPF